MYELFNVVAKYLSGGSISSEQMANGGGVEDFVIQDKSTYKEGSKWYATASKVYPNDRDKDAMFVTGKGYTKKEALADLEQHLSYYANGGEIGSNDLVRVKTLGKDGMVISKHSDGKWWVRLDYGKPYEKDEIINENDLVVRKGNQNRLFANGGALSEDIIMVKSDVMKLDEYAKKISDSVMPNQDVEAWVISKISKVEQTTANVKHTLEAEYPEMFANGGEIEHTDGNTVRMMCLHIGKYAKSILKVIDKGIEFESWMKHELAIAGSMIDSVFHYLDYFNSENHLENGGRVSFSDKVNAISKSLQGQAVPSKYRKDYGSRYDKAESKEAAKKIAGSMVQKEKMAKGGSVENKIDELYATSNFINDDFNWKLKLLEMLQDKSFKAYQIYQSLTKKEKEEVLQELFEMDNDMGSYGDGDIKTSKENLKILLADAKGGSKYAKGGGVTEFDIPNTLLTETVNVKMAKGGGVKSKKNPSVSQLHKKFSEEKKSIAINIITDAVANKLMHDNNKSTNFEELNDSEKKEFNKYYDTLYNATSKFLLKSFLERYYSDKDTREKCKGDGVKARDAIYSVVNEMGKAMKFFKFKSSKMEDGGIIESLRLPASDTTPIGLGGIPTYNTPSDIELLRL